MLSDLRALRQERRKQGQANPDEVPYSAQFCADRCGLHKVRASQVLRELVRQGRIRHVGSLRPQRKGIDGTKVYALVERPGLRAV